MLPPLLEQAPAYCDRFRFGTANSVNLPPNPNMTTPSRARTHGYTKALGILAGFAGAAVSVFMSGESPQSARIEDTGTRPGYATGALSYWPQPFRPQAQRVGRNQRRQRGRRAIAPGSGDGKPS